MSEKQSGFMTTAVVGIIAAGLGLGIGNYAAKHDGVRDTAQIISQIDEKTFDSAAMPIVGSPARGGQNASATVVIFTDLQCRASLELHDNFMDSIFKTQGDKVKVVYKAFPLSTHEHAAFAAQAVAAADKQGKFWPMFDAIYDASQNDQNLKTYLTPENLRAYAQKIGLDLAKYDADVNSDEIKQTVQKDIDLGRRFNLIATPGVFVNGQKVNFENGVNKDTVATAVNQAIAQIEATLAKPNAKYYVSQFLNDNARSATAAAPSDDPLGRSMKGNPNALVTIVEFSDYQCPFCSKAEPTIAQLLKDYPDDVRLIFTHHPLSFHQDAKLASQAAYAAGLQGKFWEMHDILFKNQKSLQRSNLVAFAQQLGLDIPKFEKDMDAPETAQLIDKNIAEANKFGLSGTPSFLINDKALSGARPYEDFKKAVEDELAQAREIAQKTGLQGDALYQEIVKNYKPAPKFDKPKRNAPNANEGKIFVDINGTPVLGDVNAPVTIVEFTDFQCPFCSRASKTLDELVEKNPGKVKVVFKHNPLAMHKDAQLAHQAAEAANLQGKFWEYYHILFNNQKALSRENLIAYAQQLGLNVEKFQADMDSQPVIDRVNSDLKQGASVNVKGTPHFFINGTRFSGARPIEDFQAAIDKELLTAKPFIDKGLQGEELYKQIIEAGKANPIPRLANKQLENKAVRENVVVDTTGNYAKGPDNAPVTIVMFSEFECPFCSKAEPTLDQLMKDYDGKIRIIFKHKPLPFHKNAALAAEAALAAGEQGKFWEMHDILFKNQKALQRDNLSLYAQQLGLDLDKFSQALDTNKFKAAVDKDIKDAEAIGVTGTPTFVINGTVVVGAVPIDRFKTVIDKALEKTSN